MQGVFELEPNAAPLTLLLQKLGTKPAINPKIEWLEDEAMPRLTTLSASATSAATALGVTADIFRVGDIVRITETGEAVEVTATATGAVTATRSIGSVAAASATSAAELFIVANANTEGATLREIKYPQLVAASNYCQIVRTPFGVTGTEKATTHYGGDEELRLKTKFGIEHARSWEQVNFFGGRDLNDTHKRFCGGLKEFISTNITADTGGLTEDDWQSFLRTGFRYGSERKVAFASSKAIVAIEKFARTNLRVNDNAAEKYGVAMKTYVSGQGIVDLVHCRWFGDSSVYGGYVFLVDMDAVKQRPLRTTKLKMNVQAPDYDGLKHEYITEQSLEVQHERRHALLTGVT